MRFGVISWKLNDDLCNKIHLFLLPAGHVCPSVICILGAVHKSRHRQILQINSFDSCSLHTRPKCYQSSFKNRSEWVWNKAYINIFPFCMKTNTWATCHFSPPQEYKTYTRWKDVYLRTLHFLMVLIYFFWTLKICGLD